MEVVAVRAPFNLCHCRALPSELFFPNRKGDYPVPREQLERLCIGDEKLGIPGCPLRWACLERALDSGAKGWHAGTDEADRAEIRRIRQVA